MANRLIFVLVIITTTLPGCRDSPEAKPAAANAQAELDDVIKALWECGDADEAARAKLVQSFAGIGSPALPALEKVIADATGRAKQVIVQEAVERLNDGSNRAKSHESDSPTSDELIQVVATAEAAIVRIRDAATSGNTKTEHDEHAALAERIPSNQRAHTAAELAHDDAGLPVVDETSKRLSDALKSLIQDTEIAQEARIRLSYSLRGGSDFDRAAIQREIRDVTAAEDALTSQALSTYSELVRRIERNCDELGQVACQKDRAYLQAAIRVISQYISLVPSVGFQEKPLNAKSLQRALEARLSSMAKSRGAGYEKRGPYEECYWAQYFDGAERWEEAITSYERVITSDDPSEGLGSKLRFEAMLAASWIALQELNDPERACRILTDRMAWVDATFTSDSTEVFTFNYQLGVACTYSGEFGRAIAALERANALVKQLPPRFDGGRYDARGLPHLRTHRFIFQAVEYALHQAKFREREAIRIKELELKRQNKAP